MNVGEHTVWDLNMSKFTSDAETGAFWNYIETDAIKLYVTVVATSQLKFVLLIKVHVVTHPCAWLELIKNPILGVKVV